MITKALIREACSYGLCEYRQTVRRCVELLLLRRRYSFLRWQQTCPVTLLPVRVMLSVSARHLRRFLVQGVQAIQCVMRCER